MSLTDWVRWDMGLFDGLVDSLPNKLAFKVEGKIKATSLTRNWATVGTAFDYAMRIKLLMLNEKCLGGDASINAYLFEMVADTGVKLFPNKRRKLFLQDFREKLSSTLRGKLEYHALLSDCIILAKLDSLYRVGQNFPDSINFEVDKDDIKDLENLTSLIIPEQWIAKKQCLLNPTFGQSSRDIGGADADIIIDGKLIDIKTIKDFKKRREILRQLIGYHILNARENYINGNIELLGIYFSRYGILYNFPAPAMSKPPSPFWANIEASIKEYRAEVLDSAEEE